MLQELKFRIADVGRRLLDRRGSHRAKVFISAALVDQHGERRAHVLDLSSTGLLAFTDKPPRVGNGVTLRFAGTFVVGRTIWVRDGHFGILFLTPPVEKALRAAAAGHDPSTAS